MGEEVEFICDICGFRKRVTYSPGFLSNPRNPATRADALRGKYGPKPKRILEEHPDAECSWYLPLFHCRCGNIASKDAVVISEGGMRLYTPSMKCSVCGRKMWEIAEPTDFLPCPGCRSWMRFRQTLLWD